MKKLFAVLSAAVMLMNLAACTNESSSQKEVNARVLKQAKENAKAYISEKYGFDAEITGGYLLYEGSDLLPFKQEATTKAKIKMKYGGKDFLVRISGGYETTNGSDTYQHEEILAALLGYIQEQMSRYGFVFKSDIGRLFSSSPGYTDYGFYLPHPAISESDSKFHSVYYDGSNLDQIQTLKYCIIVLNDCDISDDSAFEGITGFFENSFINECCIISYRNPGHITDDYSEEQRIASVVKERMAESTEKNDKVAAFFKNNKERIRSYRRIFRDGKSQYVSFENQKDTHWINK